MKVTHLPFERSPAYRVAHTSSSMRPTARPQAIENRIRENMLQDEEKETMSHDIHIQATFAWLMLYK